MFKDRSKHAPVTARKTGYTASSAVTIITAGCEFSGKLHCRGASRIGGEIEGEIVSEGLLIIEEDAKINAVVEAEEVVIQGRMVGRLKAKTRIEICSTGSFEGDMEAPSLVVHEGAIFNGNTRMVIPAVAEEKGKVIKPYLGGSKKKLTDSIEPQALVGEVPQAARQPEVTIN
jgi:cytoskeletal protein CcmA (bactofilin family)